MIEKTDKVTSIEFNAPSIYGPENTSNTDLEKKIKEFGGLELAHIEKARFIDNARNSVLFAPGHSYVHGIFLHKNYLTANPDRLALLPTNLKLYFVEVGVLTAADLEKIAEWKDAEKILILYTRCAASTKAKITQLNKSDKIRIEEAKIVK